MKDREDVIFIASLYFGKLEVDKYKLKIESLEVTAELELVGEYTHIGSSLRQGRPGEDLREAGLVMWTLTTKRELEQRS